VGVLRDLRRVFIHATPVFFDRGIANLDTKEISSVCVEPCKGESIIVTVFEIFTSEVPAFVEREHEFRFLAVRDDHLLYALRLLSFEHQFFQFSLLVSFTVFSLRNLTVA
jgi:hypothetical protein